LFRHSDNVITLGYICSVMGTLLTRLSIWTSGPDHVWHADLSSRGRLPLELWRKFCITPHQASQDVQG